MEPRITVTGNTGVDVAHRVSPGGVHVCEFTVASTRRAWRDGQWHDGDTTWLNVKCFNRLAENVAACLSKGDPVIVTGRMENSTWRTPEGDPRSKLWLIAESVGHDLSRGVATFSRTRRDTTTGLPPVDDTFQPHEEHRKAS